jgi:hypothetical protein
MRDAIRLRSIYETTATARATRAAARECRKRAEALIVKARRLRNRRSRGLTANEDSRRVPPYLRELNQSIASLKQSLRDLEGVRMTSPEDPSLQKLKADIRKTIERAAGVSE